MLAGIGGLGGLAVGLTNDTMFWAIAGAILLSVIPFTFIAIFPTNHKLLDSASPPSDADASALLARWGKLHGVRTAMSLMSFAMLLAGVLLA